MAKIPEFKNDKEAAEFWDDHDLADFEEDLEPVTDVRFRLSRKTVVSLRLDPDDLQLLKQLASEKGVGHSTLARMWVKEKLTELTSRKPGPRRGSGKSKSAGSG